MSKIKVTIDSREVAGRTGMTILDAAKEVNVEIPVLCHKPELTPSGCCRICVVEVEGFGKLVASCHTPITEGMMIHTKSAKVLAARRVLIELMLTAHTGPCVMDTAASQCELHKLASGLEVGPPRFRVKKERRYPVEEISPYVRRDMSRCILCRRCIRACDEIAEKGILSVAYRGFHSKVVVDCDVPLNTDACRDCGVCIDYCPTTALTRPSKGTC
jgi:NADH dehydrogenase/NADH:ubiquinone oxidoreductase subunit G